MLKSSTKQIDAIWIVHDGAGWRCFLNSIASGFEKFIGSKMWKMTTIIITQCDGTMKKGDYLQYPNKFAFKVPDFYNRFN
jgi:hypothetical protein